MDRETEKRILQQLAQKEENRERNRKECLKIIRDVVITEVVRATSFLMAMMVAGAVYGWHLPENIRKFIADWFQK